MAGRSGRGWAGRGSAWARREEQRPAPCPRGNSPRRVSRGRADAGTGVACGGGGGIGHGSDKGCRRSCRGGPPQASGPDSLGVAAACGRAGRGARARGRSHHRRRQRDAARGRRGRRTRRARRRRARAPRPCPGGSRAPGHRPASFPSGTPGSVQPQCCPDLVSGAQPAEGDLLEYRPRPFLRRQRRRLARGGGQGVPRGRHRPGAVSSACGGERNEDIIPTGPRPGLRQPSSALPPRPQIQGHAEAPGRGWTGPVLARRGPGGAPWRPGVSYGQAGAPAAPPGAHLAQVLQQRPRLLPPAPQHPQQLLDHADAPVVGAAPLAPAPARPALSPARKAATPGSRAACAGARRRRRRRLAPPGCPWSGPWGAHAAAAAAAALASSPPSARPRPFGAAFRRNFGGTVARGGRAGGGAGRAPPPRSLARSPALAGPPVVFAPGPATRPRPRQRAPPGPARPSSPRRPLAPLARPAPPPGPHHAPRCYTIARG